MARSQVNGTRHIRNERQAIRSQFKQERMAGPFRV